MYYTVYQITNNVNGKVYIGAHKTKNLDDDYMGSGKILKHAIEKYGLENFTKCILKIFDTPEDMFDFEAELVNEDFVNSQDTYNIKEGGSGGFDHINGNESIDVKRVNARKKGAHSLNEKLRTDEDLRNRVLSDHSDRAKKRYDDNPEEWYIPSFKGMRHSEESKRKIGEANRKLTGKNNGAFGKMWIHNPHTFENKMIKSHEPIPKGWVKGRKIKTV